jgi:hypothetical protein
MGKLIRMPKQVRPFALSATPAQPGCISKFVLTAMPWDANEGSESHGFIKLADLLDELAELGADRSMIGSVRRALEAGRACVIPKVWLAPPQIHLFKKPAKSAGLLQTFASSDEGTSLVGAGSNDQTARTAPH